MTIEEKAKAYDHALKIVEKYKDARIMFTKDLQEELFPELKESEDEKIRKGLIGYFRAGKCENISSYHGISTNDIIAWLEKQSEQKSKWSEEDERIIEALIAASNDNMLYGYVDKKKLINWFKFLKERYCSQKQWKPTEEQITWLYRAVDMSDKDSRMKQVLNELLEQLKAL